MAFNAGQYQRAVSGQQQAAGALQKGRSKAAGSQIQGQEFSLNEQVKYANKQEKAGSIFGNWKKGVGMLAGLAAIAVGAGPLAAAMLAGGGTFMGGKYGKKKAKEKLGESKFFKGTTADTMDYMDKDIVKSSVMSAAMAAGGAHLRDVQAAKFRPESGSVPIDEKSLEGWVNPQTGVQGTVQEYDALVKSRQAAYTQGGNLRPEYTGTMVGDVGNEAQTMDVYSPLRDKTVKVPVGSRELPNPQDYMHDGYDSFLQSRGDELYGSGLGRKIYEGGEKLFGGEAFGSAGQNLGFAGKGAMEWGKSMVGNQFSRSTSLYDLLNKANTAKNIYKKATR